jgi:hypothetical protein
MSMIANRRARQPGEKVRVNREYLPRLPHPYDGTPGNERYGQE